jgi:hypothetical protein
MIDPAAKIGHALALDAQLVSWAISIPPQWEYTTIKIPTDANGPEMPSGYGFYGPCYHIYNDLYSCSVWNNWRGA